MSPVGHRRLAVYVSADFASHFRVWLAAVVIVVVATVEARAADAPPRTGAQVWAAACTACHGADGAGQPVTVVGFDVPLPNLRDCMFVTSEATADWFAVVHEGGPVRGLSQMMPAFGGALSDPEIALVIDYLRGFCRDSARLAARRAELAAPSVHRESLPGERGRADLDHRLARIRQRHERGDLRTAAGRELDVRDRRAVRIRGSVRCIERDFRDRARRLDRRPWRPGLRVQARARAQRAYREHLRGRSRRFGSDGARGPRSRCGRHHRRSVRRVRPAASRRNLRPGARGCGDSRRLEPCEHASCSGGRLSAGASPGTGSAECTRRCSRCSGRATSPATRW